MRFWKGYYRKLINTSIFSYNFCVRVGGKYLKSTIKQIANIQHSIINYSQHVVYYISKFIHPT